MLINTKFNYYKNYVPKYLYIYILDILKILSNL